jgi:2'-5' RNA ligase
VRPGHALTRRLFIAFRLPASVVEPLAIWQHDTIAHMSNLRLTPPAQLHVTAVFLGSTPAAEVQAVSDLTRHAVRNARCPRFRVDRYHETARVGMLTLREELVSPPYASELTGHLMVALEASGRYVREHRAWRPHVTLARFRTPPRLRLEPPPVSPFAPMDVALYESVLAPSGSSYVVVDAFPFRDEPLAPAAIG